MRMGNQNLNFQLDMNVIKEGDVYAAYIPALDLCTHGDSVEDALKAGAEAASIFLAELKEMGTLNEVLEELGWKRLNGSDPQFVPPEIIHATRSVNLPCPA